jgi:hypothetical protein
MDVRVGYQQVLSLLNKHSYRNIYQDVEIFYVIKVL